MTNLPMPPVMLWENERITRTLTDVESTVNFLQIKWPRDYLDSGLHSTAQVRRAQRARAPGNR